MQVSFLQAVIFLLFGIALIVVLTAKYRVHAFFALFLSCLVVGLGVGMSIESVLVAVRDGFGNIMKSLGLLIVLGTTLGAVLEYTGSTTVMADAVLRMVGQRRAALAMTLTGFIVGLPIFCDSGFIVLSGLNRSLAARTRIPMSFMAVSLASGLYSVHCLIPPHPGAAAAAGLIGVDFGRLILAGIAVAIPAAVAGHWWARFAGRKGRARGNEAEVEATERGKEGMVDEGNAGANMRGVGASGVEVGSRLGSDRNNASVLKAFLPVVIPILLIAVRSFFAVEGGVVFPGKSILVTLGDPVIALLIGLLLALGGGKSWTGDKLSPLMGDAVEKAGSILVIIGAGGAFGAVLAATNMGAQLSAILPLASMGLFFPFLLTFALKTAQGSSTVAIITAASIVKPLLPVLGLATGNGPLFCILAMGAGSMMISHANDAYFWVVARFSGLDMKTMLRVYTIATVCMGVTALAMVLLISQLL